MGAHAESRTTRPSDYTRAERAVLLASYATAPRAEILAACPNRTWKSLRQEARRLHLSRANPNLWTTTELEALRQSYPTGGARAVKDLTGRSTSSIYDKAWELQLVHEGRTAQKLGRRTDRQAVKKAAAEAKAANPIPRPAKKVIPQHSPVPKANNTLKPMQVGAKPTAPAPTKRSPHTPNLNAQIEARIRQGAKVKAASIVDEIKALPADSEGRQVYMRAARLGGPAATAAFVEWKQTQRVA